MGSKEVRYESRDEPKQLTRQLVRKGAYAALAASLLTAGGLTGLYFWNEHQQAEAREQAARAAFDASDHLLADRSFAINAWEAAKIAPNDFIAIPEYEEGESLIDARRIEVHADSCTEISISLEAGTGVYLGVSTDSLMKDEPLVVGYTAADSQLLICSTQEFELTADTTMQVAVQRSS